MLVIRIRDIIKYLAFILLSGLAIVLVAKYFFCTSNNKEKFFSKSLATKPLSTTLLDVKTKDDTEKTYESIESRILKTQIGYVKKQEDKNNYTEEIKEENIVEARIDVNTEIIDSGIENKFTNTYNGVQIKNTSNYDLTEEMIKPDFELTDKKDVVIYHTHTCESYTPSEKYCYEQTGNYRTTDLNYTVAKVGDELEKYLINYNFNVIHDKTYHDYPAYTGSYSRSMDTISNILSSNEETQMIIDLHRDAIGANDNYAPKVKIGDEYVSQLMFVIGTDGGGLEHTNWQRNLKFAVKVQEKANEMYPGLFKPIVLRNSRYNQNVSDAATIIEVGATGNTLDESLNSMKYLAKVLDECMN